MASIIDYEKLKNVNSVASLPSKQGEDEGRHNVLMKEFSSMFLAPEKTQPGIPNQPTKAFQLSHAHVRRPKSRFAAHRDKLSPILHIDPPTEFDDPLKHDIRLYIKRGRRKHADDDMQATDDLVLNKEKNLGALKLLMKKLPFERSRKEQKKIYELMRDLWPSEMSCLLEDTKRKYPVLRELASVATVDTYHEAGLTVFGNTGLHMILRGSVRPQTLPYIRSGLSDDNDLETFPCPTPLLRRKHVTKLSSGDWFGTLRRVKGREVNSKVLTLLTLEPCQFLKISVADYQRILQRIKQRIQNEKVSVVQSVFPYTKWPGLSVGKLASLIEWRVFPGGTVIMEEGEVAPYIVFIRDGECGIFKQVEAVKTLPNGRRRRILKNVLMKQLSKGDSLGEYSVLEKQPFTCSVVASTDLDVGIIFPAKLDELDATIWRLLSQSVQPKFADICEEDIHTKFIEQEMKDDWDQLKHKVLLQTINYCGIRPGYGKWSNPLLLHKTW